jgi:hypothetical protein
MFGTESIGDIPMRHIAVLLYLSTTKRKERLESPQKIADALGLGSENTVVRAYSGLYSRGYVSIAKGAPMPDELPGRDAKILDVTRSGKRALRPFFRVVGIFGLIGFVVVSLLIGGHIGICVCRSPPVFRSISGGSHWVVLVRCHRLWNSNLLGVEDSEGLPKRPAV